MVSSAQQFHPDSLLRGHVFPFVKTISRHNFNLLQSVQQTLKHLSRLGVIFEPCKDSLFFILFDQTLVCPTYPDGTLSSGECSCPSASDTGNFLIREPSFFFGLPLPEAGSAPHSPCEMPHKTDPFVPMSALLGVLSPDQRAEAGLAQAGLPSPNNVRLPLDAERDTWRIVGAALNLRGLRR